MYPIFKPSPHSSHPRLTESLSCDAVVIGGGLTGVLCAHRLAGRGLSVVLLEEHTVAHEQSHTARSTAKATVAHEGIYSFLREHRSAEVSRKYAASNLAGLRYLRELADPSEEREMYFYALHGERRLQREFLALRENGIPCSYDRSAPLPFPVTAAVRLPGQLALNPTELIREICAANSFRVFEHSPVTAVGRHSVVCNGQTVTAGQVIVATNYPVFCESSGMPLKLYRKTSYAVAVRCKNGFRMRDVMAYGIDGGYGYRYTRDGDILIVSGETHRGTDAPNAEDRLLEAAKQAAHGDAELVTAWSNNDTYTHDGLPYAGMLHNGVAVACGYGAWGMTNAAGAAVLLTELICGKEVWYADIFTPYRNFLRGGTTSFSEHMGVAAGGMMRTFASPPEEYASKVRPGEAAVIQYHGKRAGAYREENGELHVVSLRCPHKGCALEWNAADRTWDCPCHGSRFGFTGECLSNPAETGIGL